ncbi:MAG: rhodanese-like domain-containing protein [Cyanobium sp.]
MTSTLPRRISAHDLADQLADQRVRVIDVREPMEYAAGHIAGSLNVPLARISEADLPGGPLVLVCHSGNRSSQGLSRLLQNGHPHDPIQQGTVVAVQVVEQQLTPAQAAAGVNPDFLAAGHLDAQASAIQGQHRGTEAAQQGLHLGGAQVAVQGMGKQGCQRALVMALDAGGGREAIGHATAQGAEAVMASSAAGG